ncbi:putative RNA methyltransferase [Naumannella halotolerans]|uniref:23S rRNA (Guanine745-N1)-methyltransferase n=1 Tax=Naumannella halotolerans TaxID=993414 RepID=A0A4R7J6N1_9ACTN|nr:hypothetical protein [Naumannella halotolerans]TDT32875.1 23S rRNA (guanine745-N1)-methyltransferase [Naumannella halotolerans]
MGGLDLVSDVLCCPVCHSGVVVDHDHDRAVSLGCGNGHRFDIARQGYVNLLNQPPPRNADTTQMVTARHRVLSSGWFDPVSSALVDRVLGHGVLLDVGSGPGWYAGRILDTRPELRGLALDVSVPAVRMAARAHRRLAAAVADTWRRLPVTDASVEMITCVFAPRNPGEFARVLAADGRLLVVTPRPDHLIELRETGALLGIQANKSDELDRQLASGFTVADRFAVVAHQAVDPALVADLIGMGPSAFHTTAEPVGELVSALTLAVDITVAVPR